MHSMRGAAAGLAGVAAMAGVITTMRRWLLTSEQLAASRTHPEKIVQRIADTMGAGELDDQTRRRLGDIIHFGYGATWGAILSIRTSDREIRIGRDGLTLGLGLWVFGFNVLLPLIRAHPGSWTWKRREFALTLAAHTTYGLTTAAALKLYGGKRPGSTT